MPATYRQSNMFFRTTAEMAAELRVEPDTLRRWAAADPAFPQPVRFNRRCLRWVREDVMAYVGTKRPQPEGRQR